MSVRILEQEKFCINCGAGYFRKYYPSGRIESLETFESRRFCTGQISKNVLKEQ